MTGTGDLVVFNSDRKQWLIHSSSPSQTGYSVVGFGDFAGDVPVLSGPQGQQTPISGWPTPPTPQSPIPPAYNNPAQGVYLIEVGDCPGGGHVVHLVNHSSGSRHVVMTYDPEPDLSHGMNPKGQRAFDVQQGQDRVIGCTMTTDGQTNGFAFWTILSVQ